jgi:hypothetical protein
VTTSTPADVIEATRKLAAILKMALPAAGYSASFPSMINLLAQQLQRRGVRPPEEDRDMSKRKTITDRPDVTHEYCLVRWNLGHRYYPDEPSRTENLYELHCEVCFGPLSAAPPESEKWTT